MKSPLQEIKEVIEEQMTHPFAVSFIKIDSPAEKIIRDVFFKLTPHSYDKFLYDRRNDAMTMLIVAARRAVGEL
jgi:hypothetical protein